MKKGKKNNEAPGGIDAMFLDTRVDNETTQKNTHTKNRQKKVHSPNYMHHKQKDDQTSKQEYKYD